MTAILKQKRMVPVFLSGDVADAHYHGFCKNVLWPLFHYIPLTVEDGAEQVNLFLKSILDGAEQGIRALNNNLEPLNPRAVERLR